MQREFASRLRFCAEALNDGEWLGRADGERLGERGAVDSAKGCSSVIRKGEEGVSALEDVERRLGWRTTLSATADERLGKIGEPDA